MRFGSFGSPFATDGFRSARQSVHVGCKSRLFRRAFDQHVGVGLLVGEVHGPDDVLHVLAVHRAADLNLGSLPGRISAEVLVRILKDPEPRGLAFEPAIAIAQVLAGDGRIGVGIDRQPTARRIVGLPRNRKPRRGFRADVIFFAVSDPRDADRGMNPIEMISHFCYSPADFPRGVSDRAALRNQSALARAIKCREQARPLERFPDNFVLKAAQKNALQDFYSLRVTPHQPKI